MAAVAHALAVEIARLDHVIRVASARTVELAAQAAQRGLPVGTGCRNLAAWVQWVIPTASGGQAGQVARRAETYYRCPGAPDLAPTRDALLAGEISGAQADVIAGTLTQLLPPAVPPGALEETVVAEAQTLLLGQARVLEPRRLSRVAAYLRHRLDPDADDRLARQEQRQEAVRGLTLARTGSAMVHVQGLLTARCGAALTAALDAWCRRPGRRRTACRTRALAPNAGTTGCNAWPSRPWPSPGCCRPATARPTGWSSRCPPRR